MLPGKAIDAAIKSRTRCRVDTFEALLYSVGSMLLPKMSLIIEKPKYTACRHCKKTIMQCKSYYNWNCNISDLKSSKFTINFAEISPILSLKNTKCALT